MTEKLNISHLLKSGEILSCNTYKPLTKEDIMKIAMNVSNEIKAKGIITIGWNGPNPQICLNINE